MTRAIRKDTPRFDQLHQTHRGLCCRFFISVCTQSRSKYFTSSKSSKYSFLRSSFTLFLTSCQLLCSRKTDRMNTASFSLTCLRSPNHKPKPSRNWRNKRRPSSGGCCVRARHFRSDAKVREWAAHSSGPQFLTAHLLRSIAAGKRAVLVMARVVSMGLRSEKTHKLSPTAIRKDTQSGVVVPGCSVINSVGHELQM